MGIRLNARIATNSVATLMQAPTTSKKIVRIFEPVSSTDPPAWLRSGQAFPLAPSAWGSMLSFTVEGNTKSALSGEMADPDYV